MEPYKVGDYIRSSGDRHIAPITGKVLKINRVTLDIEGSYFGRPQILRIRKDDLRGTLQVVSQ